MTNSNSTTVLITGPPAPSPAASSPRSPGGQAAPAALVRDDGKPPLARPASRWCAGSRRREHAAPAFDGVEALWLLTVPGPRAPEHSMNLVWAARQAGVQRVCGCRHRAAPDAPTRNGRLHALSDHEVMVSGLQWTIVKPHFFMQNLLASAASIAGQGALYYAFGEGRLGLVDTRDVAEFAARVLAEPEGHAGKTYTVTGPDTLSGSDMGRIMGTALGRPVQYVPVPLESARAAMLGLGTSTWIADMLVEYSRAYADGWGDFVTRDFPRLMQRPARGLAEFAADHSRAFSAAA